MKEHTTDKYIHVLINKNAIKHGQICAKNAPAIKPLPSPPGVGRVNSVYGCVYISFGEVAWRTVV